MPYKCTESKLTIGFGFNLEAEEMPREVAELWLTIIIHRIEEKICGLEWYQSLNYQRQLVIVDMCYQMGVAGLLKFKGMIAAIEEKDYKSASDELMDSKYARQTPNRARRNAEIMKSGVA